MQTAMPYAIVLNNQAMFFQTIGRYEEAEGLMKQAIAIAEKIEKSKSPNRLRFLSNLALLYQQMGKYNEAEAISGNGEEPWKIKSRLCKHAKQPGCIVYGDGQAG
jgi:tetratricopeptide (TPR) repeat protein